MLQRKDVKVTPKTYGYCRTSSLKADPIDLSRLMAMYWLAGLKSNTCAHDRRIHDEGLVRHHAQARLDRGGALTSLPTHAVEKISQFETYLSSVDGDIPPHVTKDALGYLSNDIVMGNINLCVTWFCFRAKPPAIWNLIIDAVSLANTDIHLDHTAAGPAEHLLAHHETMWPYFERRASLDPKFKRMMTGIWRHKMRDETWSKLRRLQADVPDPLPSMRRLD